MFLNSDKNILKKMQGCIGVSYQWSWGAGEYRSQLLVVIRCREVLESVIGGPEVQGSVGVS